MILGLVGGVGSGKSTVTNILRDEYGFTVLYTDDIAKQLELPGEPVYERLCEMFGSKILYGGKKGAEIDKTKFAEIIYSDTDSLNKVNAVIHPAVWKYVGDFIAEAEKTCDGSYEIKPDGINLSKIQSNKTESNEIQSNEMKSTGSKNMRIAVETALPDENFKNICDVVWYIYASDEVRTERLIKSRGYTREKCLSIIDSQKIREKLYEESDLKIDNSASVEETRRQIAEKLSRN